MLYIRDKKTERGGALPVSFLFQKKKKFNLLWPQSGSETMF